jgi:hypothetical protein
MTMTRVPPPILTVGEMNVIRMPFKQFIASPFYTIAVAAL